MSREIAENKQLLRQSAPPVGPVHAMMWELWRISRLELLFRILSPAILWSYIFWLLGPQQNIGEAPLLTIPVFMLTVVTSLFSGLWMNTFDNTNNGFNFYLGFSRPIRTAMLVTIPMVYISCDAALCYFIPIGFLCLAFHVPLPLFSVAALIATVCAVFIMAVWSAQSRPAKAVNLMVIMAVTGLFLIFWLKGRADFSDEIFVTPDLLIKLFTFSIPDYLILLTLFIASIAFTTFTVGRQRHGERIKIRWPNIERTDLSNHLIRWNGPFTTRRQAQYWYEMRRSGAPLLLFSFSTTILLFIGCIGLYTVHALEKNAPQATVLWGVMLLLSPFAFLLVGTEWLLGLRYRQGSVSLPVFDATQAMDNRGLMGIKLIVLFTCVFLSWLFMAAAAAGWTMFWGDYHLWIKAALKIQPLFAKVSLPYWGCIGIILFVSGLGVTALIVSSVLLFQRYSYLAGKILGLGIIYFLLFTFSNKHGWIPRYFWETNAWLLAGAYGSVTFVLWRKVLYEGFLQQRHFFVSFCIWGAYVCAAIALYLRVVPGNVPVAIPLSYLVLGLSSLLLPLIVIAATPLALAIHRHR